MKCMSCESDINPKWAHAIDNNICPFCGKNIMDENLKKLFSSLRICMEKLNEYPEQLNDWMLSNYNFIKTDNSEIINFVPKDLLKQKLKENVGDKFLVKVKTDKGEQEVVAQKIQSEEKTNSFLERAEILKPGIDGFSSLEEKTKHLKNLANEIKRNGITTHSVTSELIESDISDSEEEKEEDDIPEIVKIMANNKRNSTTPQDNLDLLKLHRMHERIKQSKENFESGSSRAAGGFSRAG
jgi:hypothetical protein